MRTHMLWKGLIHMPRMSAPKMPPKRERISLAALLVKVTARMDHGATPRSCTRWAMR